MKLDTASVFKVMTGKTCFQFEQYANVFEIDAIENTFTE